MSGDADVKAESGARKPSEASHPRERIDPSVFAHAVLTLTAQIPAAHVLTYGDVAELLEHGGPRQVGRALSRSAGSVPWWRVLRAEGHPARGLGVRARLHYEEEGTPLIVREGAADPADYRVDLLRARWAPSDVELAVIAGLSAVLNRPRPGPTPGPAPRTSNVRGV